MTAAPLGIEYDAIRKGVGSAVGVGGPRPIRCCVPTGEGIADTGKGVGRQGRRAALNLNGHRPGSAVGDEGDVAYGHGNTFTTEYVALLMIENVPSTPCVTYI